MKKEASAVAFMVLFLAIVISFIAYLLGGIVLSIMWNSFAVPNWDVQPLSWFHGFLLVFGLRCLMGFIIPSR
jgi:hypothetical protein